MRTHHLKTWPTQFEAVLLGVKTFEYRRNDRDFETGDTLVLCEFDPHTSRYSGRRFHVLVTYIIHGSQFGIPAGFCVMGVKETAR
jgi:ParB family chromosome partitioning protein